eukprot:762950-Prorocentrum_minimum.AAC.1
MAEVDPTGANLSYKSGEIGAPNHRLVVENPRWGQPEGCTQREHRVVPHLRHRVAVGAAVAGAPPPAASRLSQGPRAQCLSTMRPSPRPPATGASGLSRRGVAATLLNSSPALKGPG